MKLINLTPHDITVCLPDDGGNNRRRIYQKSGTVARVSQISTVVDTVDGVPLMAVRFGDVVGLPDALPDVLYIVSALVKSAINHSRADVISPGELVRDASGNVIGCKGFYC